jgi:hypothetical protein
MLPPAHSNRKTSWFLVISCLVVIAVLLSSTVQPRSSAQASSSLKSTCSQTPTGLADYERWFGSQHAHTGMDGDDGATSSTAAQAFAYAKNLPHLQYYIITPHLHQSRSGSATLWSETTYDTIRTSAISATTADFVAIAGQEVSTISTGGHWNLFNANDLVGADHPDGDWNDADDYYDHVASLGASGEAIAAQFNHPDSIDFGNHFDANAAPYFGTIAITSGPAFATNNDFTANGSNSNYESIWVSRLNLGWKLAPVAEQDNHEATWGASSTEYTVIVQPASTALTANNVVGGIREHMTYATEDANMQVAFTANGWSMGQTIGGAATMAFNIWWNNPSMTITNNNAGIAKAEPADDVIQTIWIYRNSFTTPVATYRPNTVSGTLTANVSATAGDWFVVKFQDTYTFSAGRSTTKDLTWSAPVWYDPAHAEAPLVIACVATATPTATAIASDTPTPTSSPTATATATQTATPTSTPTHMPTVIITPTATATSVLDQPRTFKVYLPLVHNQLD